MDYPTTWRRRHLLGLEGLSATELTTILDTADRFRGVLEQPGRKCALLAGKTCANLFFENSTRTRVSFGLAARRLGADVVDFAASTSSIAKGETLIDTARNIEAMGIDAAVIRHSCPGSPKLLSENLNCSVLNAGDGPHEHPTQALLDMLTIRQRLRCGLAGGPAGNPSPPERLFDGLTVALVGDIAHSRTARSNILGLQTLGAKVVVCGPSTLVSRDWEKFGVEVSYSLDAILDRVDVFNLLRIQFERQVVRPFPSVREYAHLYGMDAARLHRCKEGVLILAPGPINRGLELTPDVADGSHSAILDQVTNGVAVRMAALWLCLGP